MEKNIKKLFSRTALFTAGKFISKILVVLMLPLYTNCLSKAEYGTADLITNMANLIIPIACLGINEGIFRNAAAKTGDPRQFFSCGMVIFGVGSIAFLALSPLLTLGFDGYVWLIICYVLASNIHAICSQYICADGHEKFFALQGIINTFLTVALNVLFLVGFEWGIKGYVLSIILADTLTSVILVITCKLWRAFSFSLITKKTIREMLRFSLPLIPTTVFWWITSVSDRYLVAWLCSEELNGLYAVAYKIPTLLLYVVTVFNDAWKLSAVEESRDLKKCEDLFDKIFRYYIAIMFTGGALLIITAPIFAKILFAQEYYEGWIFIPILVSATVCSAIDSFFGTVYYVAKKTMYSFWTSLVGAVLNIALNLLMIPEDGVFANLTNGMISGAIGASIATFISYFAVLVIRAVTVKRIMRFDLHTKRLIITALLLLEMSTVMTYNQLIPYPILISLLLAFGIIAFNFKPLVDCVKGILGAYLGRKKRED